MTSSSVFSGKFSTTVNGQLTQNFSYDGSMTAKNHKLSMNVATNIDGDKQRLFVKDVPPNELAANPKILEFMRRLQTIKQKKPRKPMKTKRRPYTFARKPRRRRIRTRAA